MHARIIDLVAVFNDTFVPEIIQFLFSQLFSTHGLVA